MKNVVFVALIFAVMNQIIAWADNMGMGGYGHKNTLKEKLGLHINSMLHWPFAMFPFKLKHRWVIVVLLAWILGGLGISTIVATSISQLLFTFLFFIGLTIAWLIVCTP